MGFVDGSRGAKGGGWRVEGYGGGGEPESERFGMGSIFFTPFLL